MNQSLEDKRIELWIGVCVAVNGTMNCLEHGTAPKYANKALEEFDKIFPKPNPPTESEIRELQEKLIKAYSSNNNHEK